MCACPCYYSIKCDLNLLQDYGSRCWVSVVFRVFAFTLFTLRQIFLQRSAETQKCALHDLPEHDDHGCCVLPGLTHVSFRCPICFLIGSQWFFWGYSLTFSENASPFIGDLSMLNSLSNITVANDFISKEYFAFRGVLDQPSIGSAKIPAIVFAIYQLMFAAIT